MHEHLSIADLEQETGLPRHVLNHALRRFGPLPCGRVGMTRIWRQSDLKAVLESLNRTTGRRRASTEHSPAEGDIE